MLAAAPVSAQPGISFPSTQPAPKTQLSSAPASVEHFKEIFQSSKYTILGDSNHTCGVETFDFISSSRFLDTATASNVKVIGLELPQSLQWGIDGFAAGTMDHDQFVDYLKNNEKFFWVSEAEASHIRESIASLVEKSNARGIRVIAGDTDNLVEEDISDALVQKAQKISLDLERYEKKYTDAFAKAYPGKIVDKQKASDYALTHIDKEASEFLDEFIKLRLLNKSNKHAAEQIAAAAGPDRAIILYGAYHVPALKENLGQNTSVVFLHGSAKGYKEDQEVLSSQRQGVGFDYRTGINYQLDTNQFVPPLPKPVSWPTAIVNFIMH